MRFEKKLTAITLRGSWVAVLLNRVNVSKKFSSPAARRFLTASMLRVSHVEDKPVMIPKNPCRLEYRVGGRASDDS